MFSIYGTGIVDAPMPQYDDTVVHNDVWIGTRHCFSAAVLIESGCVIGAGSVIPPNFRASLTEYTSDRLRVLCAFASPTRCVKNCCSWPGRTCPSTGLKKNNPAFLVDLTADEGRALEVIAELQREKDGAIRDVKIHPDIAVDVQHVSRQALQREHWLDGGAPTVEASEACGLTDAQSEALANEFIATLTTLSNLEQHQEAEALARQMTALLPAHGFGWKALGSALLLQGHAEQALVPLRKRSNCCPTIRPSQTS